MLEEPFLSLSQSAGYDADDDVNGKYEGYVKDLATLIGQDTGVSFEIRPSRDGKYGSPDKNERGMRDYTQLCTVIFVSDLFFREKAGGTGWWVTCFATRLRWRSAL